MTAVLTDGSGWCTVEARSPTPDSPYKFATARGGDLLKITNQSTSRYNVTMADCGVRNGLDFEPDDPSLVGRVLARPVGDFDAGTVIDRRVATRLAKQKKPVIARSVMTCRAPVGICARCAGLTAEGKFPEVGDSYGITSGQALFEPVVQGALNVKHNSGAAKGKRSYAGLDVISQFVQAPSEFKDRAAVAEKDGLVEFIEEAPQGGHYITIDGERHYALPGMALNVKVGERVEAGDILSDGLANPSDIVRLRGIGEGRRYYVERFGKILEDSGQKPDPRNLEMFAKAAIDTYVVDDPDEDSPWLPDDRVREADLLANFKPAKDSAALSPKDLVGHYLQQPVLHYTVGTRITPSMAKRMERAGVEQALGSPSAPGFTADMMRLRTASHDSRDWMQSLGTSYLKNQLRESVERGDDTNVRENAHYGPRLAYGVGFGEKARETGKF